MSNCFNVEVFSWSPIHEFHYLKSCPRSYDCQTLICVINISKWGILCRSSYCVVDLCFNEEGEAGGPLAAVKKQPAAGPFLLHLTNTLKQTSTRWPRAPSSPLPRAQRDFITSGFNCVHCISACSGRNGGEQAAAGNQIWEQPLGCRADAMSKLLFTGF